MVNRELVRLIEDDETWQISLNAFLQGAQKRRSGVLIDYVYEPPNLVVPQRLYRYDVFDDYVSRHRDDFEFGFDLITAVRVIPATRLYGVYVVELDGNANHVYVGQTWYAPDERLAQHNTGLAVFHAARPFKRGARGVLRPDLYAHLPRVRSQVEAQALETATALELRRAGFRVEGGH